MFHLFAQMPPVDGFVPNLVYGRILADVINLAKLHCNRLRLQIRHLPLTFLVAVIAAGAASIS